ncbi:MAG TPA: hypothetical protein VLB83_06005, partial [Candidatus Paceibacterota bacterium]|nr:hypothetical protein [Candidatus Paceibacterota bacterium]
MSNRMTLSRRHTVFCVLGACALLFALLFSQQSDLAAKARNFAFPQTAHANYQFVPTSGTLVTGTELAVTTAAAGANEGTNSGSWKGTISDDGFSWIIASTASGVDMQLNLDDVELHGANKMIIQTQIDLDASPPSLLVQICDWVSSTSVDNAADAQCTGGGWRTLNTKDASNVAVPITAFVQDLQWQVFDGYWSTGATGGTPISTPLSNFLSATNQVKIRYYSTTNTTSEVAVDFVRVYPVVDSIYNAGGFTNLGSGTPAGHYGNAHATGNTASAGIGAVGDSIYLQVPGTAGSVADFYLSFKNIKTYTGMNTILVRGDFSCAAATADLKYRFALYNFTSTQWEDVSSPVDCAVTTSNVYAFAKNNIATLSDYISSGELRVRMYGLSNSTTNLRVDAMYVTLGTTNTNTALVENSFGTTTAGRIYADPSTAFVDGISALAIDSSSFYAAGYDSVGGDNEWRIEKRNLSDGAYVTAFGTSGVVTS